MTSAELVAALRKCSDHRFNWNELHEINTAADFIERVEALRHTLPCPTCGGTGQRHCNGTCGGTCLIGPCPENNGACDGFMSWERIVAIVAVVFDWEALMRVFGRRLPLAPDLCESLAHDVANYLRSVRP